MDASKELPQRGKKSVAERLRKIADRIEKEAENTAVTVFANSEAYGGEPRWADVTTHDDVLADGRKPREIVGREAMVECISIRIEYGSPHK